MGISRAGAGVVLRELDRQGLIVMERNAPIKARERRRGRDFGLWNAIRQVKAVPAFSAETLKELDEATADADRLNRRYGE